MTDTNTVNIRNYVDTFKAFSDITRLKMMCLLYSVDSKISVSEIIEVLQVNQYNASKHLRILREAGIIYRKREGKWNYYYYLNKDTPFDEYIRKAVMSMPKELIEEEIKRCKMRLEMRVNGKCVVGVDDSTVQ